MHASEVQVRFHLAMRLAGDGRTDILLRLYRGDWLASETVISTVEGTQARMILLMSRMQLFRLGHEEHVPSIPRVSEFQLDAA